ncbi:mannose-binding lectin [Plakobranchus ocellatus]|uniref:Mannose-binding lectin n=1 Tax=Plakobranchus ocellatus TaxID=259542 RepID=A0AAV4AUT2_9GAST|nr:mannose-binding lectin [Plakobranchus ocellatus]
MGRQLNRQVALTFIFLLSVNQSTLSDDTLTSKYFAIASRGDMGTNYLGDPWTSPSLTACVASCLIRYPTSCDSVVYHVDLHLCTPGSKASISLPAPDTATEGILYTYRSGCNDADGFSIVTSDLGVRACLKILQSQDFYRHRSECYSLGGYLAVPKTMDKLLMIQSFAVASYIGLDDLKTEGTFVWHDNGVPITANETTILFRPGEPKNTGGLEHCVKTKHYERLNDIQCSEIAPGICERPLY